MISPSAFCRGLLAVTVAVGCAASAHAFPMPVHEGQITYITGGIGDDEEDAMKAAAHDYDLLISNAESNGEFTAGADLLIRDANGRAVLQAHDAGPLFYAQLPPGAYVVDATYDGIERVRDVTIGNRGPADVHLIWPQADMPQ